MVFARTIIGLVVLGIASSATLVFPIVPDSYKEFKLLKAQGPMARGVVYSDSNHNQVRDRGERGIAGVRVSDQSNIVLTDKNGKWQLPIETDNDTAYFVIKPRGWRTPVTSDQLPKFYYLHKPNGSPKSRFAGMKPTGPLPSSIDFPLYPNKEPNKFSTLFFGDTQPRNVREVEYIRHDVVEPIIGNTDARFGITLGDIVFDDLSVLQPMVNTVALIGIPWFNVIGNHDLNLDAPNDKLSDETYERFFGPNYYSFDHGPVHFVVLDNVEWRVQSESQRGYTGNFGKEQLKWLNLDLSLIPKDQLVVFTMHIPLTGTADRKEFFELIKDRPYTLSAAAHTHYQEHIFMKAEHGNSGSKPHHHVVNVTACGSWWEGSPDEYGIPHTTMRCGAPNGYAVFTFDGKQYSIQFRAARRHKSYQMQIQAPESLEMDKAIGTPIYVNVFGGNELSSVEIRFGESKEWVPMKKVLEPDPAYVAMYEKDKNLAKPFLPLPAPINSPHLWRSEIGILPLAGMLPIHVRTKDMFGQEYLATRGIEIK